MGLCPYTLVMEHRVIIIEDLDEDYFETLCIACGRPPERCTCTPEDRHFAALGRDVLGLAEADASEGRLSCDMVPSRAKGAGTGRPK